MKQPAPPARGNYSFNFAHTLRQSMAAMCLLAVLALPAHAQDVARIPTAVQQQGQDVTDIAALIREVARREHEMQPRRFEYTWTSKTVERETGERGEVKKETVEVNEVYPVKGEFARKLVSKNGVPVPAELAGKELKRAAANIERAEREEQKRAATKSAAAPTPQDATGIPTFGFNSGFAHRSGFNAGEFHFAPWRVFRAAEFHTPRRESLRGRDALVLDFRPRADFRPANDLQKPYAKLAGRVWIDLADKALLRLEAWPDPAQVSENGQQRRAPSASPANPAVVYEETRLPDGMWLESFLRIKTTGDRAVFNGLGVDVTKEISDFKRFSTKTDDATLDPPKDKPDDL
ncbi:MAG: hypothetical protein LC754_04990 [Acidobacteria bacterium]|nr:hypothetical protein [Acidobacteriota bacterium]